MYDAITQPDLAPAAARRHLVQRATLAETVGVFAGVLLPTIAKGVILRRPRVVALAERLDFDRRAVRRMQRLRNRYSAGPLLMRIFGRRIALLFHPDHVHRVLAESPDPFATATPEKRAALAHFEPKNVLISDSADRPARRRFYEEALETDTPVHHLADRFEEVIASEEGCLRGMHARGELTWEAFSAASFRVVRRVVFGDAAREDHELWDMMIQLRSHANWAFLRPRNTALRERLFERIRGYLRRADPDSLVGSIPRMHIAGDVAPEHEIPQWLFAFDPAGMATFRALGLLAAHPDQAARAREELHRGDVYRPFLRATVQESLRLWPTSPLILRETLSDAEWATGIVPAHTTIVIFAPFFHRDTERLEYADRFHPSVWLSPHSADAVPLIPFSDGPAVCPGRNLVLLLSTAMLASLLEHGRYRLQRPSRLCSGEPLPGTLNHFAMRFDYERR